MKTIVRTTAIAAALALLIPAWGAAQENKFLVKGQVDFVSDYIWRGADQHSGFSAQPSLTMSYAGFSLNAWGSQSLTKWGEGGAKEFDINLSYSNRGLTLMVSDLWWSGVNRPYGHYNTAHWFEATVSYDFGACSGGKVPLLVSWSTVFAGGADKNADGRQNFSTYVSLSCPVGLPADITLTPAVGFLPWGAVYHGLDRTAWTDISLKAAKNIRMTDRFAIPLYVQVIVSPAFDRTYLVAGLSFGF